MNGAQYGLGHTRKYVGFKGRKIRCAPSIVKICPGTRFKSRHAETRRCYEDKTAARLRVAVRECYCVLSARGVRLESDNGFVARRPFGYARILILVRQKYWTPGCLSCRSKSAPNRNVFHLRRTLRAIDCTLIFLVGVVYANLDDGKTCL